MYFKGCNAIGSEQTLKSVHVYKTAQFNEISKEGRQKSREKVEAVVNTPAPKNTTQQHCY